MDAEQEKAIEQRQALMQSLSEAYLDKLDKDMGRLHNQFVSFISSAGLPLTEVLLVLEILKREIIDEAYSKYIEGVK